MIYMLLLIALQGLQSQGEAKLIIVFDEIESPQGNLLICLCNKQDAFTETCFRSEKIKAREGQQQLVFEDLPEDNYAISVFQDENENDELDTNIFGIPKEPYGFSKIKGMITRRPTFEKCKFKVQGDTEITLRMR